MPDDLVFLHGASIIGYQGVIAKRFEGYYTLQLITSGGVEVWYDDQQYELIGTWFWPAYPGPYIRFHPAPGFASWEHRYVAFQGPAMNRWVAAGLWPQGPCPMPDGGDYAQRFDELIRQAQRPDRWGKLRAANLLEGILIEIAEVAHFSDTTEPWLDDVLEHIQPEHEAPDYSRIAAEQHVALSTLRRRFKQATGTNLHAYTVQCRIAVARELLGETNLPIKTIATRLGYNDVYFFSRQFRQHMGVAPGAYRKSRQTWDFTWGQSSE
jgi:AraC-like DNA-binding protein